MTRDEEESAERARESLAPAIAEALPRPTPQFRRRAWLAFQRALDPLGSPRTLVDADRGPPRRQ